jgi:hypothetical protein
MTRQPGEQLGDEVTMLPAVLDLDRDLGTLTVERVAHITRDTDTDAVAGTDRDQGRPVGMMEVGAITHAIRCSHHAGDAKVRGFAAA